MKYRGFSVYSKYTNEEVCSSIDMHYLVDTMTCTYGMNPNMFYNEHGEFKPWMEIYSALSEYIKGKANCDFYVKEMFA